MTFLTVFTIVLIVICGLGTLLLIAAGLHGQKIVDQKNRREEAKIAVDELRAQRLKTDLEVVANRAHKLANDVVLGDMKIELARRQMIAAGIIKPPDGSDSATW